ncbi:MULTISPECIES: prepilin peptidase [unclassified Corynebacterium]|uniref:prepilin peptidase n=1 Tax=unclassified Corynebacterium TaxID=2624378 RepID=UPI0029CA9877|nr:MULTISPECIES: prepilin peptidase [unclassified Corynebacterium]WPF65169.1 prepilin peptidase [Corynebacterium sp. 22KM0430]WPF67665.1 prepilin peptidase [Corynebacterium sp. 21KM1197]
MWGFSIGVGLWLGALIWWDARQGILPNVLTLPGVAVSWAWALFCHQPWWIGGGVAWAALYLLVGWVVRGVGGGDVKLAASLGVLVCAGSGVPGWCVAVVGASIASLLLMAVLRRGRVPHGPSMVVSALCGAAM